MSPQLKTDLAFDADLAECRAMLRGGSRSFHAAALLLPRRVHAPATALYAFCRVADDAIDESPSPVPPLASLHARLDAVYAARPHDHAADRALARVVRDHAIPRALLDALLEGFAWDASGRRYETLDELQAYAARVAGTVGAMMAVLMGARSPEALARATDLGIAMQLSNIARDVGEDARAGRLYLPMAWLRDAGIDPADFLADPAFTPALGQVIARLLTSAEALYRRATPGESLLPLDCRPGIGAARRLYRQIGREVARRSYDSITTRAVVPTSHKLLMVVQSTLRAPLPIRAAPLPPLAVAHALVQAIPALRSARRDWDGQVAWLLDLFTRLGQHRGMRADLAARSRA